MSSRVLILSEYGVRNGGENSLLAVLLLLIQCGWIFEAAVPPDSELSSALRQLGIKIHPFSMKADPSQRQRKMLPGLRQDLSALIEKVQPDLIHSNSLSVSRIVGPVANEAGVPCLGYLRDILKLSRKAVTDINQCDRLIAVSNATRDWHVEQGFDPQRVFVVHNGVSECLSDESDKVRMQLGIPLDSPVLLFVGQIGMRKGVDILVESFIEIAKSISNLHLLIVGERNSTKAEAIEYEHQIHQLGEASDARNRIHWLGRRSDVTALMQTSTLLLHPARQEPLGRVLLESFSCGLVPITTNVGGSPEIFSEPELRDLLIEKDDIDALILKTKRLLGDVDERMELSKICQRVALEKFSLESCASKLDGHYHKLLGEPDEDA